MNNEDALRIAREVRNQMTIDGHLNTALDSIMRSDSPDGTFCILGVLVDKTIKGVLAALDAPTVPAPAQNPLGSVYAGEYGAANGVNWFGEEPRPETLLYASPPEAHDKPAEEDDLIQQLMDESDLCRNETATDIADLLDKAVARIQEMQRYVDRQAQIISLIRAALADATTNMFYDKGKDFARRIEEGKT
jgi:hypothetical protein